jgi:hypothetical protein
MKAYCGIRVIAGLSAPALDESWPADIIRTKNIPIVVYTAPPGDEQTTARNMWRLLIVTN